MLEVLDQLNSDAENEVIQARNQISDIKKRKAKRSETLADLATKNGSASSGKGPDRDELLEELELEESTQDNRWGKLYDPYTL